MAEKTYGMIKPDAVGAGSVPRILQRIEAEGFAIIRKEQIQLTREMAEEFYGEHKGKPFFEGLVGFMTSGPIIAMVLAKRDAIKAWRELMGPTNSDKARETAPNSLRALFGTDGQKNATHGSDSPASALREIKFFFPNLVVDPLPEGAAAQAYIAQQLQPILTQGLTALAKQKPSSEPLEAIKWLANWLQDNNPNKPKVVEEGDYPLDAAEGEEEEEGGEGGGEDGAAIKVQASFRGYRERQKYKKDRQQHADQDEAATKLQASFRGHLTRKKLDENPGQAILSH